LSAAAIAGLHRHVLILAEWIEQHAGQNYGEPEIEEPAQSAGASSTAAFSEMLSGVEISQPLRLKQGPPRRRADVKIRAISREDADLQQRASKTPAHYCTRVTCLPGRERSGSIPRLSPASGHRRSFICVAGHQRPR
jgi:hypothetical protein